MGDSKDESRKRKRGTFSGDPQNVFSPKTEEFRKDLKKRRRLKKERDASISTPPPFDSNPLSPRSSLTYSNPINDHENSYGRKEDAIHDETLNLIARRLFVHPTTKEVFDRLKSELEQPLLERLKELSEMKAPTYEVDLEMADSVYLLELLSSSTLQTVAKKASRGAMLLQEGVSLVSEGRELLRSAITEMPTSTK